MAIQRNSIQAFYRTGVFLAGLVWVIGGVALSRAQEPIAPEKQAKVAALKAEMKQAVEKVTAIVNQPVTRLLNKPGLQVMVYSPGWFHEGASKPDFNTVDVRNTQELSYAPHQYVTSDLNPGVVFSGPQLEFNSMTKYFYTDRSLPKKKLTDAEMQEINRLYRIIGRCEQQIDELTLPPRAKVETEESELVEVEGPLVRQPIPKANYFKAAIGISIVLALYFLYRKFR